MTPKQLAKLKKDIAKEAIKFALDDCLPQLLSEAQVKKLEKAVYETWLMWSDHLNG